MGDDRRRRRGRSDGSRNDSIPANQVLGGILDRFTSVDEILSRLDQTVSSLDSNVRELTSALNEQTDLSIEVTQSAKEERAYDFSQVVESASSENDPQTDTFDIPHDGEITKVVIGWPDGAQQAVGVGVSGVDGESLIPAGPTGARYVALNDKVLEFELSDTVSKGEQYNLQFANNDETEDHFINALIFLKRGE